MSRLFYLDIGHEPSLDPPEDTRPVVCCCDICGELIRDGDTYYEIADWNFCECCIDDARKEARAD